MDILSLSLEIYSAIRNNEVWFIGKWMELEITLSKTGQTHKDKYHVYSVTCEI
jgi:hypothetical protein